MRFLRNILDFFSIKPREVKYNLYVNGLVYMTGTSDEMLRAAQELVPKKKIKWYSYQNGVAANCDGWYFCIESVL